MITNDENLLEGMEEIFHHGPTDISDLFTSVMISVLSACLKEKIHRSVKQ
jgi:hypothetical protein